MRDLLHMNDTIVEKRDRFHVVTFLPDSKAQLPHIKDNKKAIAIMKIKTDDLSCSFVDNNDGKQPLRFDICSITNDDKSKPDCLLVETKQYRFSILHRDDINIILDASKKDDKNILDHAMHNIGKIPHAIADHPIALGVPLGIAGAGLSATLVGFGAAGIVGGSIAAGIQSSIGNVAAGSAFALMQSLGATGTFTAMTTGGIAATATSAAVVAATTKDGKDNNGEEQEQTNGEANEKNDKERDNEGDDETDDSDEMSIDDDAGARIADDDKNNDNFDNIQTLIGSEAVISEDMKSLLVWKSGKL